MLERLVGFVAGFAFAIGEAAEIDRMLDRQRLENCCRSCGVRENRVTDGAIVRDYFSRIANMLPVVTTEAAGRIEVAYIVRVSFPVSLHLRKEIGFVYTLRLADRPLNHI